MSASLVGSEMCIRDRSKRTRWLGGNRMSMGTSVIAPPAVMDSASTNAWFRTRRTLSSSISSSWATK
eukprot:13425627-Alexandrium_andersonii.AAC.1